MQLTAQFWSLLPGTVLTGHRFLFLPSLLILGGLAYRIRGGWLVRWVRLPGQVSRLVFALVAALAFWTASLDWRTSLLLVPLFWAGTTIGLFDAMDLGQNDGTFARDFPLLSLRGVLGVLPAALFVWWVGYDLWFALPLSGALMGTCYLLAKQIHSDVTGFGANNDWPEIGEGLTGVVLTYGAFMAGAIL